jgi:uncharacterized lipoprotein YmbA
MMTSRPRPGIHVSATVATVALAALAGGCSLSRPAPVKQVFLVDVPALTAAATTNPATLRVGTVNVAPQFRSRFFVYRETDLRYESDYYTEFLVAPAAMLADRTARALDRARAFSRVAPAGAPPEGDFVLDGFFEAFYVDVREPGKPAADVAATYFLSRADPPGSVPFWSKQYRRRVAATGPLPEQHAAALSGAFGEIAAELARDLAAMSLPKP